eukprot:8672689-Pyramimonas_sp.AAC.1
MQSARRAHEHDRIFCPSMYCEGLTAGATDPGRRPPRWKRPSARSGADAPKSAQEATRGLQEVSRNPHAVLRVSWQPLGEPPGASWRFLGSA